MKKIEVTVNRTTNESGEFITDGTINVKVNGKSVNFTEKDIIKVALEIEPFKIFAIDEWGVTIEAPSNKLKMFKIAALPDVRDTTEVFIDKLNSFNSALQEIELFVKDATSTKEKIYWVN